MAASFWNRVPFGHSGGRALSRGPILRGFGELSIDSSNTYEVAERIKAEVGLDVVIFPDPAGVAHSTKSRGRSDIDILRQAGFKDIRYKKQISVRDCLNATNKLFNTNAVQLDPKMKNTIADFEQCLFKDGSWEINKKNSKRTHWLDGFKNMADYEMPVIKPSQHRTQRIR